MSLIKWAEQKAFTKMVGRVASLNIRDNQYGPVMFLSVVNNKGRINTAACPAVLRQLVECQQIKVGDGVCVTYLGKDTSKAGHDFHRFELKVLSRVPAASEVAV